MVFTIALAFLLGFVLQRASLCTVASVDRWINRGRADGVLGLVAAACAAGVVILGMAWVAPQVMELPQGLAVTPIVVLGGLLLGAGSLLNGGCFVGSIVRISSGDLNFLATLTGIALSGSMDWPMGSGSGDTSGIAPVHAPAAWPVAWMAYTAFVLATVVGARRHLSSRPLTLGGRWPRELSLVATGLAGGAMLGSHPGWSYGAVLDFRPGAPAWPEALLAAIALFAGAVLSARLAATFRLKPPTARHLARCFLGGSIMGVGARLIPGGNDTLLLWTVPGLALHGLVAYACMIVAIGLPMLATRRWITMR